MYFVQPPRMTKDMSLTCVALDCFHHVPLERIPRQDSSGEWKFPRTLLTQSKVSSSFILPLEDDATTHLALNSSFSNLVSLLAPGKTIKGFHFVQSAFAVRQTETFVVSWPVVFMATVLWQMESTVVLESMSHKTAVSSSAIRESEWGLVFSVIYPSFLVFTVKLAIFLMFTVLKKILFSVWKETPKFFLRIFKFYLLF